jgi:hypothetical protein
MVRALSQQGDSGMEPERIQIILVPGSGDPPERAPEYQEELRQFGDSLRAEGVTFSQSAITFDSIAGGGYPVGAFAIALATFVPSAVAKIVVAWLRVRNGRKLRVKIGDTHVEGNTPEEVDKLLKTAAEFKQNNKPAKRGK